jgi:hypothetical protein
MKKDEKTATDGSVCTKRVDLLTEWGKGREGKGENKREEREREKRENQRKTHKERGER